MEDFHVDVTFDKGAHARIYRARLAPFTLVGAAPGVGLVSPLLLRQFGMVFELRFYSETELMEWIHRSARSMGVAIDQETARAVACRSRGAMHVANRLLRRVCDYAQVRADGRIAPQTADAALALEGVDALGLTRLDRRYLEALIGRPPGEPMGIGAIAATLQEESQTLEELVEPYLLHASLLVRTPRGRIATDLARRHFGTSRAGRNR
jgi:Holliday junction DNA helicase RuvB